MRRALRLLRLEWEAVLTARKLRRIVRCSGGDPSEWLTAARSVHAGSMGIAPTQVQSEIVALLDLLHAERPRIVLEIGTENGGTIFLFARVASDDALLVTVDADGGLGAPLGRFAPRAIVCRSTAGPDQRVVPLLRRDSHAPATVAAIEQLLAGRKVDFLFIDGDHSEHGVRQDIANFLPLVRAGGIAAFHDIVDGPPEKVGGAPGVWRELRAGPHETQELVESWEQGGYGIGLLRVGSG